MLKFAARTAITSCILTTAAGFQAVRFGPARSGHGEVCLVYNTLPAPGCATKYQTQMSLSVPSLPDDDPNEITPTTPWVEKFDPFSLNWDMTEDSELERHKNKFLSQVEATVARVKKAYDCKYASLSQEEVPIESVPPGEREALAVARCLDKRLTSFRRNNDCPRCWLQRSHCICAQCPPLYTKPDHIRRLFLLVHHKEICLAVDTAKLILACLPDKCRLVVAGMGPEYQNSMAEMMNAMTINPNKCFVLFPAKNAKTFESWLQHNKHFQASSKMKDTSRDREEDGLDIIVLDGTWSQAQKLYNRYIPTERANDGITTESPRRIMLSDESMAHLLAKVTPPATAAGLSADTTAGTNTNESGRQLRRHPIDWRTISTFEASRLLLQEMAKIDRRNNGETSVVGEKQERNVWETMAMYQKIANEAAQKQLGPPRTSPYK